MGFVIKIARTKPETVKTSCALLKSSLRTSKVFDGATLVKKRSKPYAKTNEVDSRRAGDVTICRILAT
jgi:hypothetical protein